MQTNENEVRNYENPLGQPDLSQEEELELTPEELAEKKTRSAAKELFEWVELFAYSVTIVIILFTFLCRIAVVSGPSMENTLFNGEVLIVSDLFYEPEPGDVIVFQSNTILNNEAIVKRVIATEGQVVDIDFENWIVTVDGVPVEEPYIRFEEGRPMDASDYAFPLTVEEGKIFVMGDNRNHSTDSRSDMIGQVDTRYVLGKVLLRFLPLDKIGLIN
ncbi:MAG: signal peptidase I [Clostridia bacterium]|nr:signal peptidase I [Clostridia bacterium]